MAEEGTQGTPRRTSRSSSQRSQARSKGQAEAQRDEKSGDREENPGIIARVIKVAAGVVGERAQESPGPTEMLRDDHDKVRALFKEYEGAGERASQQKKKLVGQITRELEVHAAIEEKIFYQAFREVQEKDPKKVVRESFEEHKIVKTLLAELAGMEPRDEQYDAKVTVLQESVEHHADEEERELFPAAEKLFDEEKLDELARRMTAMKQELTGERRSA
ncbi:MAG TPA: hemerythrin domain-containing protein [Thermoanaerobaculia bacterium]|nr:hemerythrin domain-containing protein [Thermoanaerobaculia bacterium]